MYHGSFYFTTPVETVNPAGGEPIKAAGVTSGNICSGFTTVGNNRLRYDGATQRVFAVDCSFSVSSSGATDSTMHLYKNDQPIKGAHIERKIAASADVGAGNVIALVRLNKGDYVELWCQSIDDGDDITIQHGLLRVTVAG
jgi:hypothetical protein